MAVITAPGFLGWVSTDLSHPESGGLSHSSWQIPSSSISLDGKCLWAATFRSLHRYSMGFRSVPWLGHLRTVRDTSVCVGSQRNINRHPRITSHFLRFSSSTSLFLAAFSPYCSQVATKTIMLSLPWFTRDGIRCLVIIRHSAAGSTVSFWVIRPESFVLMLPESFKCCFAANINLTTLL